MSLRRLKSANKQFTYSVFGYLRRHEKNKSLNIPTMIKYLCLDYYLLSEKFTEHGEKMQLNKSQDTCEALDWRKPLGCNMVYGDIVIDNTDASITEYEWKFQIRYTGKNQHYWFAVGIHK